MILRLITAGMEQVSADLYQTQYRTIDFILPEGINLNNKKIVGVELVADRTAPQPPTNNETLDNFGVVDTEAAND